VKLIKAVLSACTVFCLGIAMASEDAPPEHKQWMKDMGKQMGELRKGINVEANATAMQEALKQTGGFWKGRNSEAAMKSCKESFEGAKAVATAAKADDKAGIAAGMKLIGAGCKGCHDAHREKVSETEYKIK
jgi:cytochrome c556